MDHFLCQIRLQSTPVSALERELETEIPVLKYRRVSHIQPCYVRRLVFGQARWNPLKKRMESTLHQLSACIG